MKEKRRGNRGKKKRSIKVHRTEQRETKRKEKEEAKARMEQKRVHREKERAQKAAEKENKRPAESTLDETGRICKRLKHATVESIIDENMCCVCLGLYEEDEDTGRTWLQCTCSRWIQGLCYYKLQFFNQTLPYLLHKNCTHKNFSIVWVKGYQLHKLHS